MNDVLSYGEISTTDEDGTTITFKNVQNVALKKVDDPDGPDDSNTGAMTLSYLPSAILVIASSFF